MSRLKRGTVREDGKLLWRIKDGKEIWVTKEQYQKREKTRKNYCKKRYEKWKEEFPLEKRIQRGYLNPETGLYFFSYSILGKEIWLTKDKFESKKITCRKNKLKHYHKLKKLPPPSVCPGDKHPEKPDLYVVRLCANKVVWGTYEQYCKHKEARNASYRKYHERARLKKVERSKEIREERLSYLKDNPSLKRRRGDIDPILNLIFWGYSSYGNEVWMTPERFTSKRLDGIANRKKLRERNKNGRKSTELCEQGSN